MIKNTKVLLLLQSIDESEFKAKELEITHLGSTVLYTSQKDFVALLIESSDFYVNDRTTPTAFQPLASIVSRSICYK